MELLHYWRILLRSWPIIVGLPLLVALLTAALYFLSPPPFLYEASMLVTQKPIRADEAGIPLPNYENYHSWVSSEYINDDLLQVMTTRRFAQDIATRIQSEHNIELDPVAIQDGIDAQRQHRVIMVEVLAPSEEQARWIGQTAVALIDDNGLSYWKREDTATLDVSILDMPEEAVPEQGLFGLAFDIVLRGVLATILATGIAFLRHYLDRTVRQTSEVEALGFELVGAIPRS